MDQGARAASFDGCFEHQAWVRALAERLCGEANAADDLAQETWLEVARRTGEPRSTRAWLGGIVRHVARRVRARDEARRARERAAARAEAMPSSDTLLAQAELQRHVLAAVAALDEASRVVVLLRHYEGCDSVEIARRLGVPASTVRNRLARAHEKLRGKLDREYGGERAAWSLLLAPALSWKSSATAAAGLGVAMKVQFAVVAVVVAIAAVFLWPKGSDEDAPSNAGVVSSDVLASADEASAGEVDDTAREAAPEQVAVAAASVADEPLLVFGDLRGLDGAVLDSGNLSFIDERGAARTANLGAQNTYSIFGLKPGAHQISAWLRGFVPLAEELVLPANQARFRHDITLERALVLPVKLIDRETREPFEINSMTWRSGLAAVATLERPARIAGVLCRTPRIGGVGIWYPNEPRGRNTVGSAQHAGVLEVWNRPPLYVSCVLRDVVLETRALLGDERELVFELDAAELASKLASMTLRCIDGATGRALEGARVAVEPADGGGADARGATDANGRVDISGIGPGMGRLSIVAEGFASFGRWIHFEPGAQLDVGTIELLPRARITGRVVDAQGNGISARMTGLELRTQLNPHDLDSRMHYESAVDGSFDLTWLESDRVRLVANADGWALAALDVDARSGVAEGLEIKLERGTPVWLRGPSKVRANIDVLVVDASGRELLLETIYGAHGPRLRLVPGRYELRVVGDETVAMRHALVVGDKPIVFEVTTP